MGRGTVALFWLMMLAGIAAAYGMGVADGRKRAEGLAAERERDYQCKIQEVCRMLVDRVARDEGDNFVGESPPDDSRGREGLARARSITPAAAGGPSIQSPLVARGP